MTEPEKIVLVKAMSDETDEEVISAFLSLAGDAIYHYADPYQMTEKEKVLEQYGNVQVKAAAYYIGKRGWDFQTGYSENGLNRTYEVGDLPPSILREITTKAGIIS